MGPSQGLGVSPGSSLQWTIIVEGVGSRGITRTVYTKNGILKYERS